MCGIVGYVGSRYATPILLDGLQRLQYRGYDSAGIAVLNLAGKIEIEKTEGKLGKLLEALKDEALQGSWVWDTLVGLLTACPTSERSSSH